MVCRLIEDQEVRLREHQLRQGNTSAFAAGKVFDPFEYIVSGKQKRSQRIADFRVVQGWIFVRNFFKQRFIGMQDVMLLIVVADLHLLLPSRIVPASGSTSSLISFKIVVFPVPLSPMIATCSPRFNAKERSENNVLRSKVFARCSTVKTSFPLSMRGSAVSAYRNAPQLAYPALRFWQAFFPGFRHA